MQSEVPEEVTSLLEQLVVPCRYFQPFLSTAMAAHYGYCWRNYSETPFQHGNCKGCRDFSCGLFEPKLASLPEGARGYVHHYHAEAVTARTSGGSPFTWENWQTFRLCVLRFGGGLKKDWSLSPSKMLDLLRLSVAKLPLEKFGLPEGLAGETVFGYFVRVYPKGRHTNPKDKETATGFREAVVAYLAEAGVKLRIISVMAKANQLLNNGKTPDD